jgi:predicted DNA binding protein
MTPKEAEDKCIEQLKEQYKEVELTEEEEEMVRWAYQLGRRDRVESN